MKRVDFFYDFACPYAYLAHTQIEALCARTGAELVWRPFLLGGVFRALGTPDVPAAMMPAPKARLNLLDMHRWALAFGVPLVMPETHPNRTVLALRAAIASDDLPRASKALFHAYWALALDLSRAEVVRDALDRAGFDGAALVAAAEEESNKQALRRRTDEAIAAGVFGAPACVVTVVPERDGDPAALPGALFWGQDRLAMVERALGGEPPARLERAASPSAHDLVFYFDFSSPFAYLAATQVERIAASARSTVVYRPFLLGALFKQIGTPVVPLFAAPEAKQRHYRDDMQRWALHWDVPLRFPTRFPMNSVKALRLVLAAPTSHWRDLIAALFRAAWADDRDLGSDDVLASIATDVGLDGAATVLASHDAEVRRRLFAATSDAVLVGLCGAPTFVVGEHLIWGQDRLDFVERSLRGVRLDRL